MSTCEVGSERIGSSQSLSDSLYSGSHSQDRVPFWTHLPEALKGVSKEHPKFSESLQDFSSLI